MRFLFVDKIKEISEASISGSRYFAVDAPMQYADAKGTAQIAPGVISEAVGQLVSWLTISKDDFQSRPVFLFADKIEIIEPVKPGSTIDITARIEESDEKTFVFSGEASVAGRLVHRVSRVNGFYMPLHDLEDPEMTRDRFACLTAEGLQLPGDEGRFNFTSLVDNITEKSDESITTEKTFSPDEKFYQDHFPRFPVTPIVMINEMIGLSTAQLVCPKDPRTVIPVTVDSIKIRNFVKPGDKVQTTVKIVKTSDELSHTTIHTIAEVKNDSKTLLRGRYSYKIGS
jgi:3-hydroxyacyl-[acyl-carrier-protein] dehydratase